MKIYYWSDYACPYCYIGITQLKQALEELGINDYSIEMAAFELDPDASTQDTGETVARFAKKYGLSNEAAQKKVQSISDLSQEAGIGFNYADTHYTNTFNAHRLTKFAQLNYPELAEKLSEELYKAYFVDKKKLADIETLIESAVKVGLEKEEVENFLNSNDLELEVREDEAWADELGIYAVPFFVLEENNRTFGIPGALPVEKMKIAIEKVTNPEE